MSSNDLVNLIIVKVVETFRVKFRMTVFTF